jgi:hypothetical protein
MHQITDFAQTSGILALRQQDRFNPGHPVILSKNTQMITFSSQKDRKTLKAHPKRPLVQAAPTPRPTPNRAFFRNTRFTPIPLSRRRLAPLPFVTKGPKRPGFSASLIFFSTPLSSLRVLSPFPFAAPPIPPSHPHPSLAPPPFLSAHTPLRLPPHPSAFADSQSSLRPAPTHIMFILLSCRTTRNRIQRIITISSRNYRKSSPFSRSKRNQPMTSSVTTSGAKRSHSEHKIARSARILPSSHWHFRSDCGLIDAEGLR